MRPWNPGWVGGWARLIALMSCLALTSGCVGGWASENSFPLLEDLLGRAMTERPLHKRLFTMDPFGQRLSGTGDIRAPSESYQHTAWPGTSELSTSPPATEWYRAYGGLGFAMGICVEEVPDGGFVVAGVTAVPDEDGYVEDPRPYLYRVDSDGSLLWERTSELWSRGMATCVRPTLDGGYIAAGFYENVYLARTDGQGNRLWLREYELDVLDMFYSDWGWLCGVPSVWPTMDGGFVVAAYDWEPAQESMGYVFKTDALGQLLWERRLTWSMAYSIQQTRDGGYIVAGSKVREVDAGFAHMGAWLAKLGPQGDMVWEFVPDYSYGETVVHWPEQLFSVDELADGGYVASGSVFRGSEDGYQVSAYVVRMDSEGELVWDTTFGTNEVDFGISVCATADGGWLVGGFSEYYDVTGWARRFDAQGDVLWHMGGDDWAASSALLSARQTTDGGYILVGITSPYDSQWEALLVKLSSDTELHPEVTVPERPSGPSSGEAGEALTYSTGGASCSQGHGVEYRFDWDDGSQSDWSASASASKMWDPAETTIYQVRAQARCAVDASIVSDWSPARSVTIDAEVPPEDDHVELGPLTIYADAIEWDNARPVRMWGNVNVNGFLRLGGELILDVDNKTAEGAGTVHFADINGSVVQVADTELPFTIDATSNPALLHFRPGGVHSSGFAELGFTIGGCTVLAKEFEILVGNEVAGIPHALSSVIHVEVEHMDTRLVLQDFQIGADTGVGFGETQMRVEGIELPGGFKLNHLDIRYIPGADPFDPATASFSLEGSLRVPYWDATVGGALEVLGGELNAIGIDFESDLGVNVIPLPPPPNGLYLQRLRGTLSGLATPTPAIEEAGVALTLGPEKDFVGTSFHLLRLDITATIGKDGFSADGTLTVFWEGGRVSNANVTWDDAKGLWFKGNLNLFGILRGEATARVGSDGVLRSYAWLACTLPEDWEFIGGHTISSVRVAWVDWDFGFEVAPPPFNWPVFSVLVTPNPHSAYAGGWGGQVPLTPVHVYVGANLDKLWAEVLSGQVLAGLAETQQPLERSFHIPPGQPYIIVRVEGDVGSVPDFGVVDPDGTVITPEAAIEHPKLYAYSENPAIGEAWLAVHEPQAGVWTLSGAPAALGVTEAGTLDIEVYGAVRPPELSVTAPEVDTTTTADEVQIEWQGESEVDDATVSLYCTPVKGEAGFPIAEGLPLSGAFAWDVRGTPPGVYWVYGVLDDWVHTHRIAYADGTVTIEKDPPIAVLEASAESSVGSEVVLNASGSTDPWDSKLRFDWQVTQAPEGSAASLVPLGEGETAAFVADVPGMYGIEVCVEDPFGAASCADTTISAVATPGRLEVSGQPLSAPFGTQSAVIAAVYDHAGAPFLGAEVRFAVESGPGAGLRDSRTTNVAGKAALVYSSDSAGPDSIRVWAEADSYEKADPALRAEVVHLWLPPADDVVHTVTPGWTLFGLPVEPEESGFGALEFDPEPTDVHMQWWNPDDGAYEGRDDLELRGMRGYWLFVTHDHGEYQVCLEGAPLTGDQEYELGGAGWQLVSPPHYPLAWGAAEGGAIRVRHGEEVKTLQQAFDAMWVHHTLSAWNTDDEDWDRLSAGDGATLVPWTGYFLFTHQDDLVLLYSEEEQGQALWNQGQALSPAALSFDPGEPPLPPMLAEPGEGLTAVAYPSPVRGGVVTFAVRGPAALWVEAIRVRVHDLSGRLVYEDESAAASLLWDTMGPTGAPVASGVYLYTVHAKLNGEWVSIGVDRLLILR